VLPREWQCSNKILVSYHKSAEEPDEALAFLQMTPKPDAGVITVDGLFIRNSISLPPKVDRCVHTQEKRYNLIKPQEIPFLGVPQS
jgi:hypothetical protein